MKTSIHSISNNCSCVDFGNKSRLKCTQFLINIVGYITRKTHFFSIRGFTLELNEFKYDAVQFSMVEFPRRNISRTESFYHHFTYNLTTNSLIQEHLLSDTSQSGLVLRVNITHVFEKNWLNISSSFDSQFFFLH